MKSTYDVTTPSGGLIGQVRAKDLHCAAKQARRKFWPKGESRFRFCVGLHRAPACDELLKAHTELRERVTAYIRENDGSAPVDALKFALDETQWWNSSPNKVIGPK